MPYTVWRGEKLERIFGDMVQASRLATHADGLHVLGDTLEELAENYAEMLRRVELSGLSLKPSDTVICPSKIVLLLEQLKDWN